MTKPKVELYYGYVESEDGIHHAFEVVDPKACVDDNNIAVKLAKKLSTSPKDERFNFNSMYLDIPDTIVERIKADANIDRKEPQSE